MSAASRRCCKSPRPCRYGRCTWQGPPVPVQQVMMAALRPLALARGYRTRYPRFEAQVPDA